MSSRSPKEVTEPGRLCVVATPIGNLEDITLRALRVLREADWVLAEDTRRTRGLLTHHRISVRVASLHAHTSSDQIDQWIGRINEGAHVALVSDAGTPLVSDPGAELVARAVAAAIVVEPIPGPSALTAAIAIAAIPAPCFRFVGFLPRTGARRAEALTRIVDDPDPTVFFESPERLCTTLADLAERAGPERVACVCRELTKLHEEVLRGTVSELAARLRTGVRGEVTVVLAGAPVVVRGSEPVDLDALIDSRLKSGTPPSALARQLSREFRLPRSEVYARILERKCPR